MAKRVYRVVIDEGLLSEVDWELFAGQLEEYLETEYGFEDVEVEEET